MTAPSDPANDTPDGVRAQFTIVNRRGLHARASAQFVRLVERFDVRVTVSKDDVAVGGTSIMGLMLLVAGPGSTIDITAHGPDAAPALKAIGQLIESKFGEPE